MLEEHTGDEAATAVAVNDELLTLTEALEFLGISRPTMYRLLDRGEVKGLKVGSQWRFRQADLAAYLERGPVAMALGGIPADVLAAELDYLSGELGGFEDTLPEAPAELTDAGEREVFRCVAGLLRLAAHRRASDMHLEPGADAVHVRFRVDGVLYPIHDLPKSLHAALVLRIKAMANMDPVERRLPQDGRFTLAAGAEHFNVLASCMPTVFGEALTLKLLISSEALIGLTRLHLCPDDLAKLQRWLARPFGLVLAAGPSGCGKTTTLYSCLHALNRPHVKIMTVEDPVEYLLPGTVQIATNQATGLTFSTVLRTILRQDPDILLVGEIRDVESIIACASAALTGHLVFTALHTEDAAGSLRRMLDVGVAPFLVTSTVAGVIAQRLVRKLCDACKQPADLASTERAHLRQLAAAGGGDLPDDAVFYRPAGCAQCAHTGYYGRLALFELLELTHPIKEALMRNAPHQELLTLAIQDGMHTLAADGLRKAAAGLTSVEEVLSQVGV